MANQTMIEKPMKFLKLKIAFIIGLMIINACDILLSFLDKTYWLYEYHNFSLIDLMALVVFLVIIYILKKSVKKNAVRPVSIGNYWIFVSFLDVVNIIMVSVILLVIQIYSASVSMILLFFKTLFEIVLIIIENCLDDKEKRIPISDVRNLVILFRHNTQ